MRSLPAFFALSCLAPGLFAQPATQPSASSTAGEPSGVAVVEAPPPRPTVTDPMLASPPPATRTLGSWIEAEQLLRSRSTDLKSAASDVRDAEGQARGALAGLLPTLSAQGTAGHRLYSSNSGNSGVDTGGTFGTTTTNGTNTLSGRVSVTQPLLDLRALHALGTSELTQDAALLAFAEQRRVLSANLASVVVAEVAAERVAELNRVGLRSALERLALTQAKERTGTGTRLDIVRAQQDVAAARASVLTGDESLLQAREALGQALGLGGQVGVAPGLRLDTFEQDLAQSCRVISDLSARSDLKRAGTLVRIAERRGEEVQRGYLPTLAAQSTLASSSSNGGSDFRTTWDIQAVLSIPIWDGGTRAGQHIQSEAALERSAQSLEALRRSTTLRLTQAQRAVSAAERSRDVAAEQRQLAAEVERLSFAAYRSGSGTSLDLVVSAGALRQAELNLALSEFSLVRARLARVLELTTCAGGS